jgi:hypothetical protein
VVSVGAIVGIIIVAAAAAVVSDSTNPIAAMKRVSDM